MTHVFARIALVFAVTLGIVASLGGCTGGPQPAPPFDPADGGLSMDASGGQSGNGGTAGAGGTSGGGGGGGMGGTGDVGGGGEGGMEADAATDGGDGGVPINTCDLDASSVDDSGAADACVPTDAAATD